MNRPGESGDFLMWISAGGWSLVLRVVGCLQIDGWDVAAVFVEAVVVEPVHQTTDRWRTSGAMADVFVGS